MKQKSSLCYAANRPYQTVPMHSLSSTSSVNCLALLPFALFLCPATKYDQLSPCLALFTVDSKYFFIITKDIEDLDHYNCKQAK